MSASSSGSWAGAHDILDLDRFMRGARPETSAPDRLRRSRRMGGGGGGSGQKRFSHDSGLSDGSRARRPRRRRSSSGSEAGAGAGAGSLQVQRAHLARVHAMCERLGERRGERPPSSDITSSSLSTRDLRRKDRRRSDECKTYKIIMSKLDDLSRLFAARARPQRSAVTVVDKLVGTEPLAWSSAVDGRWQQAAASAASPPAGQRPHCRSPSPPCLPSSQGSYDSGYDLGDHRHLNAQARRSHRSGPGPSAPPAPSALWECSALRESSASPSPRATKGRSLCALCHGCARAVYQYLSAQLWWPPD